MPDSNPANLPPHPGLGLDRGIALFNQGQYYACHDVLEALWMEANPLDKPFYQGILQIAVGLYHLGNHNWQGAMVLLGEGVNRLRPFEPDYQGVAVARLVDCGWAWLMALQQGGKPQVADLAEAAAQVKAWAEVDRTKGAVPDPAEITVTVNQDRIRLPMPFIYSVGESISDR
jgi:uncharacterized protein